MRWALIACEALAIAALLRTRRWRTVPLFVAYLAASIPLGFTFEGAWISAYNTLVPLQVMLAIVCCGEAIRNATRDAQHPFNLWLALLLTGIWAAALVSVWLLNNHESTFTVIRDGRAAVLTGLAMASATARATLWIYPCSLYRWDRTHLALWSVLMVKGATLALMGRLGMLPGVWAWQNQLADDCGAVVTICCLLWWVRAAGRKTAII